MSLTILAVNPLTIDLHNLDPEVSPLIKGLLKRLQTQSEEQERANFRVTAHTAPNRAYSDNEPDYSDVPAYPIRNRS